MRKRSLTCLFSPLMHTLFAILMITRTEGSTQEGVALKMLMASADPGGNMIKQWSKYGRGEDPCAQPWVGVNCRGARGAYVTHLFLDNMNLTGFIPEGTVSQLARLKVLSLSGNGLTGQIPADLINCTQLDHLYLQHNGLWGAIPSLLSHRLKRINLSDNKLSGTIPPSLADMNGLLSLFLQNNLLQGPIPPLIQTGLADFNVSNNNLSGQIPPAISSKFSAAAFLGNALLCGSPLQNCTIIPGTALNDTSSSSAHKATRKKLTTDQMIAIVIASCAFAIALIALCFCICTRITAMSKEELQNKAKKKVVPREREDFESISFTSAGDEDKPRLVFFEETNTFRLEDLLRASAELLGRGSLGRAYKAMMEDGRTMCVKRLKELVNNVARREFEEQMQLVGRLRHPNVVPLWAYYYAKEEKLLVYEYQPNGNLHTLLMAGEQAEGNGGQTLALSWNARLRIVKGIAKGLAYLHRECEGLNMSHGSIKASNILLDKDYEARIADFGLASLSGKPPHGQAPELNVSKQGKMTQKADVYSFGVLLLEILTGRVTQDNEDDMSYSGIELDRTFNLPQWVNSVVKEEWSAEVFDRRLMASVSSEEALISMLQIAMACTSKSPEQRPPMSQVHKLIADIHEQDDNGPASIAADQAQFRFALSSDDSTMTSTQAPFYDDHDVSFRF